MRSILIASLALALAVLVPRAGSAQSSGQVRGTVTSSTGRPLAGASVTVDGTGLGAQTDASGRYSLEGVPAGSRTVRATMIGYGEATQPVTVTAGQAATANLQLAPQAIQLGEVVAIGYGTTTKRDLTGSVATISGEDVDKGAAPVTAVSNALQGKAAGVQVVTASGTPGAGASVRIRGTSSISANSEPLYIVDGIPAATGTTSGDPTYNPLNSIDPKDIESIQVLKDASATSIYGSRGANGVVLITTKRGRAGQNRVTVQSSYGIQSPSKVIHPLSGPEYMRLVNEAYANSGREPRYTEAEITGAPTYDYVDLMLDDAPQQSHSLTFSGGDVKTQYLISGNYANTQGIMVNSGFERYAARVNLDRNMTDRFRVGTSLSMTRTQTDLNRTDNGGIGAGANGILAAINFDPSLSPKDENGLWHQKAVLGEQLDNPYANAMEIRNPRRVSRLLGNVYGELDVTDGLTLRSNFDGNFGFERTPYYAPRTIAPGNPGGSGSLYTNQLTELTTENTANYRRELSSGSLELLGGFSAQTSHFEDSYESATQFPSDAFLWNQLGSGTNRTGLWTGASDWTLLSWYGRANFNLAERYLFTVNGRYDGSSKFGANNKWAFFPSAAFAWRISDEPFMRDQGLFSNLKLRLSYGKTGNQAVTEYQSLARLSARSLSIGTDGYVQTMAPSGSAANPNLKWETANEFDAGLDAGFLDNRVSLSADVYTKTTNDLLLWVSLPRTSGFDSQLQNLGSVRNRGVELSLNTINVEGDRFSWRSTLNVSANRNEVLDLGGVDHIFPGGDRYGWFLADNQSHIIQVGEPLGAFYGYRVDGLYQQGDACALTNESECAPGEYRVADLNGDGVIDSDDRTILGYADPKFYGGFINNFRFGPFSLDAFLNFSQGNRIANVGRAFTGLATGFLNESELVLDRWTPENTNTMIPRANNARPRRLYSTMVEDGSFIRLQTLTLGYQLPSGLLGSHVDQARVYVTGENVWISDDYSGWDPEVNSISGSPTLRGVDSGAYPRAKSWNLGVSVTF